MHSHAHVDTAPQHTQLADLSTYGCFLIVAACSVAASCRALPGTAYGPTCKRPRARASALTGRGRTRARSVEAALGHLRRANPRTQLLVLGVLPRGWTDAAHVYAWPSMYAPGIAALNAELAAWAARDADAVFLNCGAALLPGGKVRSRGATPAVGAQALCWETCGVRAPWLQCRTGGGCRNDRACSMAGHHLFTHVFWLHPCSLPVLGGWQLLPDIGISHEMHTLAQVALSG